MQPQPTQASPWPSLGGDCLLTGTGAGQTTFSRPQLGDGGMALRGKKRQLELGPFREGEPRSPHAVVSDLNSRLASHTPRLQAQEPRLPLPSLQELEAIKKVAQILIMLGDQVIPAIIGEPPKHLQPPGGVDVPSDPVNDKQDQL